MAQLWGAVQSSGCGTIEGPLAGLAPQGGMLCKLQAPMQLEHSSR